MTQVPASTLEKPLLLKNTSELSADTVITGSKRHTITHKSKFKQMEFYEPYSIRSLEQGLGPGRVKNNSTRVRALWNSTHFQLYLVPPLTRYIKAEALTKYGLSLNVLTVGGPDAHVLENHSGRRLHDHLDWLLPVEGPHITITLVIFVADGCVEREVRGIYYLNAGLAVVVNL